jgi:predicted RNase H-like nuclease
LGLNDRAEHDGNTRRQRRQKTTLLVGFNSAWTANNSGALAGILRSNDGKFRELDPPRIADYRQAEEVILKWQAELAPKTAIVLLDQPNIVPNPRGQRPAENIVGSPVGLRYGGMQPANKFKKEMFGSEVPLWPFLTRFAGPANPLAPHAGTSVIETYPVLVMIELEWMLPDSRPTGRLPKYNPERKKTFSNSDWQHVCGRASDAFRKRGLTGIVEWIVNAGRLSEPRKEDQNRLDACVCLQVALHLAEGRDCLMVGDLKTGYIVVPHSADVKGGVKPDHWGGVKVGQ